MGNNDLSVKQFVTNIFSSLLRKPGDRLEAKVTDSGRQVIKIKTDEIKRSATRYPGTGTIVETIVRKIKK